MPTTEELRATIETYVAAWAEADESRRWQLLERVWAEDGVYTDALLHIEGREALTKAMADFQERRPGEFFELISTIDYHHNLIRFLWRWCRTDGSTKTDGVDFGELASDGRLQRIVGFVGREPQAS